MTSIANIALTGFLIWSGAPFGAPAFLSKSYVPATTTKNILSVGLTGYNALPEQTDDDSDMTASGVISNPSVIAARSRDLARALPYGTVIALETPQDTLSCGFKEVEHLIGYRVVADAMHGRKHRQIDVMFDEMNVVNIGGKETNPAVVVGVCNITVRVVGKMALKDIPDTQEELAMIVSKKLSNDTTGGFLRI